MGENEVEGRRRDEFGQGFHVALDRRHPIGYADLAGPASQGGQGIGADVDHRHVGTQLGQRDRETAAAAAAVEHVAAGRWTQRLE